MSTKFHRKHERVPVELAARFSVLVPEDTFQPVELNSTVLDISERGVMVLVQMDQQLYSNLLTKTRFCRITFSDPSVGLPEKVTGKAVWIQPQNREGTPDYRIGVFFEDCPASVLEKLRTFVESNRTTP